MRSFDDDVSVQDARDEGVIAGRAVTSDDAALATWVADLRGTVRESAPEPSAELAALFVGGAGADDGSADRDGVEGVVVPLAGRRRRAVRYTAGAVLAAALIAGGGAAAAEVRAGTALRDLPAAVTQRIGDTVGEALEGLGLRASGPGAGPSTVPGGQTPGQGGQDDGVGGDPSDGGRPDSPGASPDPGGRPSEVPADRGVGTGQDDAPGRPDDPGDAATDAPGQDGNPGQDGEPRDGSDPTGSAGQGSSGGRPSAVPTPGQSGGSASGDGSGAPNG